METLVQEDGRNNPSCIARVYCQMRSASEVARERVVRIDRKAGDKMCNTTDLWRGADWRDHYWTSE